MLRLIARRLAIGVLVAFTVMTLAFLLTRLSGDLAVSIAGPSATTADVEIIRKAYGLDRPLYVQFFAWTGRAMVGDFGQSYFFKDSVANLIFFFQAEDGIRDLTVTGVQTCALPI